jgi:hypothetical protein
MVSTHFGGDAFLVASDGLRLRFVRDRGQLFLEVQARLPEIESMFSSKESFKATKVKLEELKSLRAKEMFG